MGKASYAFVNEKFNMDRQSEKLDNFYSKLIASWPALPECHDDRK